MNPIPAQKHHDAAIVEGDFPPTKFSLGAKAEL
jgi:hypothetical protein